VSLERVDKDSILDRVRIIRDTRRSAMAKVTSKLQVTIPKVLADRYGIRPGDDIEWESAGQYIRVVPPGRHRLRLNAKERLEMFDAATERQRERESKMQIPAGQTTDRGWTREELYQRGSVD
jgi:AbrB family looped-hinge helix DNA binding protein